MISSAEISAVAHILNQDHEGKSVEDVAKLCINALDSVRSTIWRPIGAPLRLGDTFKGIISKKVHHVAWMGMDKGQKRAWVITADSVYGWLGCPHQELWKWREETRTTQATIDKMLTNADGHRAGDILVHDHEIATIVATCARGVLIDFDGSMWNESNESVAKFYKKVSV